MSKFFSRFVRNEDGATMVEYGLMVALIAVACITAVTALGTSIQGIFGEIGGSLDGAIPDAPAEPTT